MAAGSNFELDIARGSGKTVVTITGLVNELAEFERIRRLEGAVEINLRAIRRFNSAGVRVWVDAIRELTGNASVTFVECAPPVVDQLNMITGFLGRGRVVSFIGPMMCPSCDATDDVLFDADAVRDLDRLPPVACPACGLAMELDDVEDQYLLFLREPTFVGG